MVWWTSIADSPRLNMCSCRFTLGWSCCSRRERCVCHIAWWTKISRKAQVTSTGHGIYQKQTAVLRLLLAVLSLMVCSWKEDSHLGKLEMINSRTLCGSDTFLLAEKTVMNYCESAQIFSNHILIIFRKCSLFSHCSKGQSPVCAS